MDWQIIISQNENLNEVYKNFSKDMTRYLDSMNEYVSSVSAATTSLGNSWKGTDYSDFKSSMMQAINTINVSLNKGKVLRDKMDEAQKELARGLEKLRTTYGSRS